MTPREYINEEMTETERMNTAFEFKLMSGDSLPLHEALDRNFFMVCVHEEEDVITFIIP